MLCREKRRGCFVQVYMMHYSDRRFYQGRAAEGRHVNVVFDKHLNLLTFLKTMPFTSATNKGKILTFFILYLVDTRY